MAPLAPPWLRLLVTDVIKWHLGQLLSSFWLINMKRLVILKQQRKKTSITWRK